MCITYVVATFILSAAHGILCDLDSSLGGEGEEGVREGGREKQVTISFTNIELHVCTYVCLFVYTCTYMYVDRN